MNPPDPGEPDRQPAAPDPGRPDAAGLRQAAHRYADAGWPVFPCRPGQKTPATRHGYLDATTSHTRIDRWWTRLPEANVSIATGNPGPDVLDVDVKAGRDGFTALRRASQAGLVPAPIAVVRTPSGGAHLYFPGTTQRCGALPACRLDFRATGGSIIAPPSWSVVHGRRYQLLSSMPGGTVIEWGAVRNLLKPARPASASQRWAQRGDAELVARLAEWLETRPAGNRNYPLFWAARTVTVAGLMDAAAREQLIAASQRSGLRGGEVEARRTVASGEKAGRAVLIASRGDTGTK